MKNYSKLLLFALVAIMAIGATSCNKYKGFKKDKETGFYYKPIGRGYTPIFATLEEMKLS